MTEQQQRRPATRRGRGRHATGLGRRRRVDVTDARQNSLWSDAWGSLKRNPLFWIGAVLGVLFVLMAIFPQLFARGADPRACDLANSKAPPSAEHWFGFDQQGCDYLANVVYGARNSLIIGLLVRHRRPRARRRRRRHRRLLRRLHRQPARPGSPTSSSRCR